MRALLSILGVAMIYVALVAYTLAAKGALQHGWSSDAAAHGLRVVAAAVVAALVCLFARRAFPPSAPR